MIKSTSKETKTKIQAFIMNHFKQWYSEELEYMDWLTEIDPNNYSDVCNAIERCFFKEKIHHDQNYKRNGYVNLSEYFWDWCSGLCSLIDTEYMYHNIAREILADWLNETDIEKERYSESDAERTITNLLWREISNNATKGVYEYA